MTSIKDPDVVLRSINLYYDADHPERIIHYVPTTKSVRLLRSLLGELTDRCFLVVAPYGSGKSLTASYLLQLVENRKESRAVLEELATKVASVSKSLGDWATKRVASGVHGAVVVLQGHQSDLPEAVQDAVLETISRIRHGHKIRLGEWPRCTTMRELSRFLEEFTSKAIAAGIDHISFVWDEFGRHIEGLVASGRSAALDEIQTLAELISRLQAVPFTLAVLLHQTLLNYAGNTPSSIKKEWRKIEGRFETLQYVDDSREVYQLIADVVGTWNRKAAPQLVHDALDSIGRAGYDFGYSGNELETLIRRVHPLSPATLYLLPRVSARVAQNERTIFTFLSQCNWDEPVTPAHLYDYFSESMRTDTSVGGTYKQWIETESALSKVSTQRHECILKTACLLSLGLSGERARSSMANLREALQDQVKGTGIDDEIATLIAQKLLLYRKHTDSVSLWHGTDYDLRGRLEDEKSRQAESFDLVAFLTAYFPPDPWKPLRYNSEFGVVRFYPGRYILACDLTLALQNERSVFEYDGADGIVLYAIPQSNEDLVGLDQQLRATPPSRFVVVCLPQKFRDVYDAALETACLVALSKDHALLNEDPMMAPEVAQMLGDSELFLQQTLDSCFVASGESSWWYHGGIVQAFATPAQFRNFLSDVTRTNFPLTPVIQNEMFVRQKLRANLVNSRKKLVLAILDNTGLPDFSLEGSTPDVSLFRTMFLNTGLYRPVTPADSSRWRFAEPEELVEDQGLREVWTIIRDFFTTPSEKVKQVTTLFECLVAAPYGLRTALLPVLFAAGLKAFPSALSVARRGDYLPDILSSTVEEILRTPNDFSVHVHKLDADEYAYVRAVIDLFGGPQGTRGTENDILRALFDTLTVWKSGAGPAMLESRNLSASTIRFQKCLNRELNPYHLLFRTLPQALGYTDPKRILEAMTAAKLEMASITGSYYSAAREALSKALELGKIPMLDSREFLDAASDWARPIAADLNGKLSDQVTKGFLNRLTLYYVDTNALIDSLASILVGKAVARWDDSSLVKFRSEVAATVDRLEELILHESTQQFADRQLAASIVQRKARTLYRRLSDLLGSDRAEQTWNTLTKES